MSVVKSYLDLDKDAVIDPMTEEAADLFMRSTFAELAELKANNKHEPFAASHAVELGVLGRIFQSRLVWKTPQVEITVPAAVFLIYLADNPAGAVMWAYTVTRMWNKKKEIITMGDIAEEFPMGFPNEKQQEELWNAQKVKQYGIDQHGVGTDNMLDIGSTWLLTDEAQECLSILKRLASNPADLDTLKKRLESDDLIQ